MTRTVYRHSRAVPRHSRGSGNPLRLAFIFAVISLAASPASGQVVTGVPPFGSFSGGPDIVNNANLNVHIQIPVVNKAGRGIPFSYTITFDSSVWYPSGGVWLPVASWGWGNATQQGGTGYVVDKWTQGSCRTGPRNPLQYYDIYSQWRYYDAFGAIHPFSLTLSDAGSLEHDRYERQSAGWNDHQLHGHAQHYCGEHRWLRDALQPDHVYL